MYYIPPDSTSHDIDQSEKTTRCPSSSIPINIVEVFQKEFYKFKLIWRPSSNIFKEHNNMISMEYHVTKYIHIFTKNI